MRYKKDNINFATVFIHMQRYHFKIMLFISDHLNGVLVR